MCTTSLNKRECLNDDCTSYHVKGTRRRNSKPLHNRNAHQSDRHNHHQSDKQQNESNQQRHYSSRTSSSDFPNSSRGNPNTPQAFLEVLDTWTAKFMNCLSQKLQHIPLTNQPAPMNQQQSLLNQLLRQHQGATGVNPTLGF